MEIRELLRGRCNDIGTDPLSKKDNQCDTGDKLSPKGGGEKDKSLPKSKYRLSDGLAAPQT
jgi:hypothetical protein